MIGEKIETLTHLEILREEISSLNFIGNRQGKDSNQLWDKIISEENDSSIKKAIIILGLLTDIKNDNRHLPSILRIAGERMGKISIECEKLCPHLIGFSAEEVLEVAIKKVNKNG